MRQHWIMRSCESKEIGSMFLLQSQVNVTMVYQMTVKSEGTMSHQSILKQNIKRIIIFIFF